MVRFKNRWLLAELIFPEDLTSNLSLLPSANPSSLTTGLDVDMDSTTSSTEKDDLPLDFYPSMPGFMVPTPSSTSSRGLVLSSSGSKTTPPVKEKDIWFAVKETIVDVFGDAGWAKVGSSFNVRYYSPTTNLCIFRVAREHFRTAWGGLTFCNSIAGKQVVMRVVCCSGTIKKSQHAAIRYTRLITAQYLSHALTTMRPEGGREDEVVQSKAEKEMAAWDGRRKVIEEELGKMEE